MRSSKILLPLVLTLGATSALNAKDKNKPTNFVIIFCDDLGYGDLACFGNPTIKTPNLDKLASEGQKWSNFYVAESLSGPSRGALLTGKYGPRTGLYGDKYRVLFPQSPGGMAMASEHKTIQGLLKERGYTTACVGKWHLGCELEDMPIQNGFDYFYGLPFSNDMSHKEQQILGWLSYKYLLPFYNQEKIIATEPDQREFTQDLTKYAVSFIEENKKDPFFLYLAHPMPHIPVYASKEFEGKSKRGLYGDVIEELDWSVGEIIKSLKKNKLDENTVLLFTSDNGPWLISDTVSGSSGPLRNGKNSMYEGGFKVPAIFWGKGVEHSHVVKMGTTLDVLPTICEYAGIEIDKKEYDGTSLVGVLKNRDVEPRDEFYYYRGGEIFAVRKGAYKLHVKKGPSDIKDVITEPFPLLYNIDIDIAEKSNIADKHPNIVAQLKALIKKREEEYPKVKSIFDLKFKDGQELESR